MSTTDQLVATLWRRRFTFLLAFVCVLGAVAAVTYALPKEYSTSAYVIVNTNAPATSGYDAQQVSEVDTQSIAELLLARNTANEVASQLPYPATGKQVQGQVGVSPVANTLLVLIKATGSTPWRAQQLANGYALVAEQRTGPASGFARVSPGDPAPLITAPSSPRTHLYLLIGAILAAMAGTGAAILRDTLDKTVRIDGFDTEAYGLPILARVPQVGVRRGWLRRFEAESDLITEGLRWVFAQLAFVNGGERPQSIAVVSADEKEGKSTICVALAYAAADTLSGEVLLVDADLRRPNLAQLLDLARTDGDGLSSYLAGTAKIHFSRLAIDQPNSHVALLSSGPIPPNPTSLLGLPRFAQLAKSAKRAFGCVVFDTPPIRAGADASLVAAVADCAILVIDARTGSAPSVRWSIDQLRRAHVNLLGVIVNRVTDADDLAYYGYGPDPERHARRMGDDAPEAVGEPEAADANGAGDTATPVSTD